MLRLVRPVKVKRLHRREAIATAIVAAVATAAAAAIAVAAAIATIVAAIAIVIATAIGVGGRVELKPRHLNVHAATIRACARPE